MTAGWPLDLAGCSGFKGLPIEILQSIQALTNAQREYTRAVADYNVAQFTLHRSLGWPVDASASIGNDS